MNLYSTMLAIAEEGDEIILLDIDNHTVYTRKLFWSEELKKMAIALEKGDKPLACLGVIYHPNGGDNE
jgi:hypothetical protein